TRRTIGRGPPQKSRSVTTAFVTLQRAPPLTRIFAPGRRARSSSTTESEGLWRRVKIAVARPAAPAPTIATSHVCGTPPPTVSGGLPERGQSAKVAGEGAEQRVERLIVARIISVERVARVDRVARVVRFGGAGDAQIHIFERRRLAEELDGVHRQ